MRRAHEEPEVRPSAIVLGWVPDRVSAGESAVEAFDGVPQRAYEAGGAKLEGRRQALEPPLPAVPDIGRKAAEQEHDGNCSQADDEDVRVHGRPSVALLP